MLNALVLACMLMFAQQAAQLHALAHAGEQLAQPHKGKAANHPFEQCIAYHAVGSALTASLAAEDFATSPVACALWSRSEVRASAVYRPSARAPPQPV